MTDRRNFLKGMGAVLGLTLLSVNVLDGKETRTFRYSAELIQDLNMMHDIDAEKEMLWMMANEMGTTPENVVVLKKEKEPDEKSFGYYNVVTITTK